jgi:hypothetical protein
MRTKVLGSSARGRAALALTSGALVALAVGGFTPARAANPPLPAQFSGLLNDYTPGATPYEMHGKWTLDLNAARGTATFTAEMTMEFADFAIPADPVTGNHDPTKLGAHTHHISVTDGIIHNDPTGDPINWMSSCAPSGFKPAVKGGFVVTGSANVTGNGANAPFGNSSPVTICVLGGVSTGVVGTASVTYSNITLTFGAPASGHFGTQAINGVVSKCELAPGLLGAVLRSSACSVAVVTE